MKGIVFVIVAKQKFDYSHFILVLGAIMGSLEDKFRELDENSATYLNYFYERFLCRYIRGF
jgi:hypothetical protein